MNVNEPPGQDELATGKDEIGLANRLYAQADVELLRASSRRAGTKVHVTRRARDRIEAAGPREELTQARARRRCRPEGCRANGRPSLISCRCEEASAATAFPIAPLRAYNKDPHNAFETNVIPLFLRSGPPRTPSEECCRRRCQAGNLQAEDANPWRRFVCGARARQMSDNPNFDPAVETRARAYLQQYLAGEFQPHLSLYLVVRARRRR